MYMYVSPPHKNSFYVPVYFSFPMCPFQSTNSYATKQDSRPTPARAHKIYSLLSKILLTRVSQLRRDLAQYGTPYSQYQYQYTHSYVVLDLSIVTCIAVGTENK